VKRVKQEIPLLQKKKGVLPYKEQRGLWKGRESKKRGKKIKQ